MKARRHSKKLAVKISGITNTLFKECVIDVMNAKDLTEEDLRDLMFEIRKVSMLAKLNHYDDSLLSQDILAKKHLIDEMYIARMMALPTKILTDILFLHDHQTPRRNPATVEAIVSELARRSIFNDSSQSDAIDIDGDVDVERKGRKLSKTAKSKKRKTSKN